MEIMYEKIENKLKITQQITVERVFSVEELKSAKIDLETKLADIDEKLNQAQLLNIQEKISLSVSE